MDPCMIEVIFIMENHMEKKMGNDMDIGVI